MPIEDKTTSDVVKDPIDEVSRSIATRMTQEFLDAKIVRDPNLNSQKNELFDKLFDENYEKVYDLLKGNMTRMGQIPNILEPFLKKAPHFVREQYQRDCEKILQEPIKVEKTPEFEKGELPTFAHLYQFSQDSIAWLYGVCLELINQQNFDEAISVLKYINLLNHKIPEVWLSYGFCLQSTQQFEEAIKTLKVALELNPDLLQAKIISIDCHLSLNQYAEAEAEIAALEKTLLNNHEGEKYLPFLEHFKATVKGGV